VSAERIRPDEDDNSEQTVQEPEGLGHRGEEGELLTIINYVDERRRMMRIAQIKWRRDD
jgi:hypothetical protein